MRIYTIPRISEESYLENHPKKALAGKETMAYNCEAYVFGKRRWLWSNHTFQDIKRLYSVIPFSQVHSGVLIAVVDKECTYRGRTYISHYAKVTKKTNSILTTEVISKWGRAPLLRSTIREIGYYGSKIIFFKI